MTFQLWIAFAVMEFFLALSPGPAVLLISSQGMKYGARTSSLGALGISSANLTYFFISAMGVSALLLHAGTLLLVIKFSGAFYLMYLGVMLLIESFKNQAYGSTKERDDLRSTRSAFSQAYITQISNPKAIIFFTTMLPQFVRPNGNIPVQISILAVTTTVIETTVLITYGWLGSHGGKSLKNNPSAVYWIDRISGVILFAIGLNLILLQ